MCKIEPNAGMATLLNQEPPYREMPTLPPQRFFSEANSVRLGSVERWFRNLGRYSPVDWARFHPFCLRNFIARVHHTQTQYAAASDWDPKTQARELSRRLKNPSGHMRHIHADTFALIRETSRRVLCMEHYDVQLIAGLILLNDRIAQMNTGEGKSFTATLPAITMALAGWPVHVITTNDYLVRRDFEEFQGLYGELGLTTGYVVEGQDNTTRREAYSKSITYCNGKELIFDYLRDQRILQLQSHGNLRLKLDHLLQRQEAVEQPVLRGLHYALIDEIDSVLIDEARLPCILSQSVANDMEFDDFQTALGIAGKLLVGEHYVMQGKRILLTDLGTECIDELASNKDGVWQLELVREELVVQAVYVEKFLKRDVDYLVRDGKIVHIDQQTGRTAPDRHWSGNIQGLVEAREGCELSQKRVTSTQITCQRFYRRYLKVAGMSGTVESSASEFWRVYGLRVSRIPTHKPNLRHDHMDLIHRDLDRKWKFICQRIAEITKHGRPVLLGTASVAQSQIASRYLNAAGIDHDLLNADQDAHEAELISRAGQKHQVTIATNMAGRGTDIKIRDDVAELGGLFVIQSERQSSQRIDRQLAGRCARQGDPGEFQAILSYEDPLFEELSLPFKHKLTWWLSHSNRSRTGSWLMRMAQRKRETRDVHARSKMLLMDEKSEDFFAFSGHSE